MQPKNTNQPLPRTADSLNSRQQTNSWMPMYCDKPLATDKRCGYTKIRHGCIVRTCASSCPAMPWCWSHYGLRCHSACGNRPRSTVNNSLNPGPNFHVCNATWSCHYIDTRWPCTSEISLFPMLQSPDILTLQNSNITWTITHMFWWVTLLTWVHW